MKHFQAANHLRKQQQQKWRIALSDSCCCHGNVFFHWLQQLWLMNKRVLNQLQETLILFHRVHTCKKCLLQHLFYLFYMCGWPNQKMTGTECGHGNSQQRQHNALQRGREADDLVAKQSIGDDTNTKHRGQWTATTYTNCCHPSSPIKHQKLFSNLPLYMAYICTSLSLQSPQYNGLNCAGSEHNRKHRTASFSQPVFFS